MGVTNQAMSQEAYAVLEDGTLSFYYDDKRPKASFPMNKIKEYPKWFDYSESIEKVVFNSSFENYNPISCFGWFGNCKNLTEIVDIDKYLNTANVEDMSNMFSRCSKLSSINLSSFNTDRVTDMSFMFEGCNSLKTLDVRKFNTTNVTDMTAMFNSCNSIVSLDVSGFNTENVTQMMALFADCSNLTSIDLSTFNTEKVSCLRDMFKGCSSALFIDLGGFNTARVNDMSDMFNGCSLLEIVYVDYTWITENVQLSKDMFLGCLKLVGRHGTKYNSNYRNITYARLDGGSSSPGYFTFTRTPIDKPYAVIDNNTLYFRYDKQRRSDFFMIYAESKPQWIEQYYSINKVVFSDSFSKYKPLTCNSWFNGCKYISEFEGFENLNTELVGDMGSMFRNCSQLSKLDITTFNTANVEDMSYMFASCNNLSRLEGTIETAKVIDMSYMFSGCSNLTSLDVSNFDTHNVINMSHMFDGCKKLPYVDVSNFVTSNVTDMGYMFNHCDIINGLNVSNFITKNVTNMSFMFGYCEKLEIIDVSNFETDIVTAMDGMFNCCSSLRELDVTNFKTGLVTTFSNMFNWCSSLLFLDLRSFSTANVSKMSGMFNGCSQLHTICVSDMWTISPNTLGVDMFANCNNLYGGAGTKCNDKIDFKDHISSARIDGGIKYPGYLSNDLPSIVLMYVSAMPKTDYLQGEELSVDGGVVSLLFSDEYSCSVDLGNVQIMGYDSQKLGLQTLTLAYLGKTTTMDINVKSITKVELTQSPFILQYYVGEELSLLGGEITIYYNNGTSTIVSLTSDDVNVSGFDSQKIGVQTLTIEYREQTIFLDITITEGEKAIVSIAVNTLPQIDYIVGEDLCLDGGELTVSYNNSTTEKISLSLATISGYNKEQLGHQTLTVEYGGYSTTFDISVKDKQAVAIFVSNLPKTEYIIGEDLCLDGGELTVSYNNSTTEKISLSLATISGYNKEQLGHQILKIQWLDQKTSYEINICDKSVLYLVVSQYPKIDYYCGEELNLEDGVLTVVYNNNTSETISLSSCNVTGFDNVSTGLQTLIVIFAGQTTSFDVTVRENVPIKIELINNPKIEYTKGQLLELNGGELSISYSNGTKKIVDLSLATAVGYDSNEVGIQTITVEYLGLQTTFEVTVKKADNTPTDIIISHYPTTTVYFTGQSLDLSGGEITVLFDNGDNTIVNLSEAEITGYDRNKVGTQTLTVSYLGMETTFEIVVKDKENGSEDIDPDNPSTAVSEISNTNIRIWSFGSTVYVENATSDIYIVNLSGSLITKRTPESSRMEICLNNKGVYIVKTGDTTQKIIIQ